MQAKIRGEDLRLAVDVGNTNTVIGMFQGAEILRRWRLATRKDATVDELAWWLRGLTGANFEKTGSQVRAAALASVVPAIDDIWVRALENVFAVAPEILNHVNCLGLRLDYDIPAQIGADRLANVLGAHALGYKEGVIVDFGTATTFDVFTDKAYCGGVICAGIQSSMRSLAKSASKLSEVELSWPVGAVGKTTEEALRIGILKGMVGQVDYLLTAILSEKKMRAPSVITTGGLASWLEGRSRHIHAFAPDLTLIGINHLLSDGKKKGGRKA